MLSVKNNLNSPQQIMSSSGPVLLAPFEHVSIDGFAHGYEALYRQSPFFTIEDNDPDAPDHDGGGENGGSKLAEERGLDHLRQDAVGLGIEVDRRWGEKRLQAEIDKALSA